MHFRSAREKWREVVLAAEPNGTSPLRAKLDYRSRARAAENALNDASRAVASHMSDLGGPDLSLFFALVSKALAERLGQSGEELEALKRLAAAADDDDDAAEA